MKEGIHTRVPSSTWAHGLETHFTKEHLFWQKKIAETQAQPQPDPPQPTAPHIPGSQGSGSASPDSSPCRQEKQA